MTTQLERLSCAVLFAGGLACVPPTPSGDEAADTETTNAETDTQSSESGEECNQGDASCPCYGNGTCNDGLACNENNICEPAECVDGTEGCSCYGNGTCNPGLECNDANLCEPAGSETQGDGDGDMTTDDTDTTADTDTTDTDTSTTGGEGCDGVPEGMVCVPAGSFEMGTDFDVLFNLDVDPNEQPAHPVTISTTFWLDETEVTAGAYQDCYDAGECSEPTAVQNFYPTFNMPDKVNHPINGVNWYQAVEYCEWVGKRLPTEAEWEYAARGEENLYFPWGNDLPTCEYVVAEGCGTVGTAVVGSKPLGVSPFGALDMSSNVMEWCSDYYDPGYYYVTPEVDPQGPMFSMFRSLRGSTFLSPIAYPGAFRSTTRGANQPTESVHAIGFRCAQTPP